MSLQGKVAIVTGATSGIGRATAELLAAYGAAVAVTGRRVDLGEQVVDGIRKRGGTALFIEADIRDSAAVDQVVTMTAADLGAPDILVNNAGVIAWGSLHDQGDEVLDELVAVNLAGTIRMTRAVLPHLLDKRAGKIVNLSTATAVRGFPGTAAYSAVKAGVLALTRTWATEYGPLGINVNAVAPGPIETAMTEQLLANPDMAAQMIAAIPARRVGQPRDVASAVGYLVGPDSDFIHGVTLPVDGGVLAS
jgi:NAD(P)-dependent dehydrogenase (short-subunit alcohol dehydrogenase family)